jgi:xanthine/uracil permease
LCAKEISRCAHWNFSLALKLGGFTLGGIGTATFGAIVLYQLFRESPQSVSEV